MNENDFLRTCLNVLAITLKERGYTVKEMMFGGAYITTGGHHGRYILELAYHPKPTHLRLVPLWQRQDGSMTPSIGFNIADPDLLPELIEQLNRIQ